MKQLYSIALALAALTALATPAAALGLKPESLELLQYFQSKGGEVYVDSLLCDEYAPAMGLAHGNKIHICSAPHHGDFHEMEDTIRHELWHVIQFCNGSPITKDPLNAITTAAAKGWTGQGYNDPNVWHSEAEAYYVAKAKNETFIRQSLDHYCFQ